MQGSPVQFEFVDVSPVEKRLNVEVSREHVNGKLEQAYRELSRQVNLRGFRKGKAPRELLERMFGKKVAQDVLQELLQDSMAYVGQQVPLRMTTNPILESVSEIKRGQPLRYAARIEIFPVLDIQDWEGIEVERRAAQAKDEDVEAALERRRREHKEMIPIEGRDTAQDTDQLQIRFTGELGTRQFTDEALEVELWDPRGQIPGLNPALLGIPLSAKDHPVKFSVPADFPNAELAGKEVTFTITVQSAHERRLPDLDDDFAKDTGEAETLDELRAKIREQLLKDDEELAKDEVREALLDELVRRNPIPIPPSFMNRLIEQNLEQYQRRAVLKAMQEGKDPRSLTEAELREEIRLDATRQLAREFVLMGLADKEKIEATPADVEKRFAEIARETDKSVSRVRAEYQKEDPDLSNFKGSLRIEKALDLLESRAKIKEAGSP
jgi:trigger factor